MNGDDRWTPRSGRLEGRRVVLLARTPHQQRDDAAEVYRSSPVIEAEEAIVSFLRALLAEGGKVTMIADEPLALLGAVVAGEYAEPFLEEQRERPPARLTILTESRLEENDLFDYLEKLGQARVRSIDDMFDSVTHDTRAVIVIGDAGADSVAMLHQLVPRAAIYGIDATGLSGELRERFGMRMIDAEAAEESPLLGRERPFEERRDQEPVEQYVFPAIALAAQLIVQRLTEEESEPELMR